MHPRRTPTDREAEKEARRAALLTGSRGLHRGTYAGGTVSAAPKPVPWRCPTLLEMARDRPCLLLVPGICNHRTPQSHAGPGPRNAGRARESRAQGEEAGAGARAGEEETHACTRRGRQTETRSGHALIGRTTWS